MQNDARGGLVRLYVIMIICIAVFSISPRKAMVKFRLPVTMTTYRIHAVACDKGSRLGSYQPPVLVVKDLYMEPDLPAFLTRGDIFRLSISAFNKTDFYGIVNLSVKSDEAVSLSAGYSRSLTASRARRSC